MKGPELHDLIVARMNEAMSNPKPTDAAFRAALLIRNKSFLNARAEVIEEAELEKASIKKEGRAGTKRQLTSSGRPSFKKANEESNSESRWYSRLLKAERAQPSEVHWGDLCHVWGLDGTWDGSLEHLEQRAFGKAAVYFRDKRGRVCFFPLWRYISCAPRLLEAGLAAVRRPERSKSL